jgi:hypothetical protein
MLDAGCDLQMIAAAAMQAAFCKEEIKLEDIVFERKAANGGLYRKLIISVGRQQRIAPNHIVSAVAERAGISGRDIGKIEIFDDKSIVGVPADQAEHIVSALKGLKINGCPATSRLSNEKPMSSPRPGGRRGPRLEGNFRRNDRGPRMEKIEQVIDTGCKMFHFGDGANMAEILEKMPEDVAVLGNISPSAVFKAQSSKKMALDTQTLLVHCMHHKNFIISSGCDIPADTAIENIDKFFEVVNLGYYKQKIWYKISDRPREWKL